MQSSFLYIYDIFITIIIFTELYYKQYTIFLQININMKYLEEYIEIYHTISLSSCLSFHLLNYY
jgi:hypothetical protein